MVCLQRDQGVTAAEVGVDGVCDEAGFQIPPVAQGMGCPAGHIQVFGKDKLNALHQNFPAVGAVVGGNGDGLHPPRVFGPFVIHLRKDDRQCHTFPRADLLYPRNASVREQNCVGILL